MTWLRIYLIGIIVTVAIIDICCVCNPEIRDGLRKVQIDKVLIAAIFWPIFWIFAIFFVGRD